MRTNLRSVLVVDDDPNKRLFLKLFLQRAFETEGIYEFESGIAATEFLLRHDVAVIITDYKMQPVDGLELTRWIRKRTHDLPIMRVTGHPEIQAQALRAGVNFGFDPFQLADLETAQRSTMRWNSVSQV